MDETGAAERLPLYLPDPYAVLSTGGSTGEPVFVAQPGTPWGQFGTPPSDLADGHGLRIGQVQLVTLPLSHGFGFGFAYIFGLGFGHPLVIMDRFRA